MRFWSLLLGKLLPHEESFFDFFEKQAALIIEAAQLFVCFGKPNQDHLELVQKISTLEKKTDQLTHMAVEALHKTFITPFERTEIYKLVTKIDDIMDNIEDAAKCIVLYKLKDITFDANHLGEIVLRSSQEIQKALQEMRKMKTSEEMEKTLKSISALENEGDIILSNAVGRLFEEENDPRLIMKWKEVYEYLEHATDNCEDVSNIIEGVLLE